MRLGHDTVVALFSRRVDDDDATVRADLDGGTGADESPRSRLIPLAIIAVLSTLYGGIGAYWLVTGAPPAFLAPSGQRAKLDIPPRPAAGGGPPAGGRPPPPPPFPARPPRLSRPWWRRSPGRSPNHCRRR